VSAPIPVPPGSTLGLFSPASPGDPVAARRSRLALKRAGYRLVEASARPGRWRGYLAGTDEGRLECFRRLWTDGSVDAYLARRGGYGCLRLLPLLGDWRQVPANKPIIGFSDITALHLSRFAHTGVGGWHAPVFEGLIDDRGDRADSFFAALAGGWPAGWGFRRAQCLRPGEGRGPLLGGNLTTLMSLAGTPHLPPLDGAILVIEDVKERIHSLDRLLSALALLGIPSRLRGLVFGQFVSCGYGPDVKILIKEAAGRCPPGVPVVAGATVGHGDRQAPFWMGEMAELRVDGRGGELSFLERI
jgi:muramoyltetrapeptide carboxypeptidase